MLRNKATYGGSLNVNKGDGSIFLALDLRKIEPSPLFLTRIAPLKPIKEGAKIIFLLALFFALFYCFSFAQDDFVYNAKGERDPFMPLVTSDGRFIKLKSRQITGGLELEGIIYDKISMSYAIVNGLVVKVGDFVGDYQVLKIEEKKVIFIKEGQPFEVELKKEE